MSTGQNRSAAVMNRRQEALDGLDDFPTPPWAGRALFEHVLSDRLDPPYGDARRLENHLVWEPACNRGYLAAGIADYVRGVYASDIFDYSADAEQCPSPNWAAAGGQRAVHDFLFDTPLSAARAVSAPAPAPFEPGVFAAGAPERFDWIVTNPPFRLGAEFVLRALDCKPRFGAAMFVRTAFIQGQDRYRALFRDRPPDIMAQFAERPFLCKGRVRDPAHKYFDAASGKWRRPSTATAYCWLVWLNPHRFAGRAVYDDPRRTVLRWIPPCREALTRPGDYPPPETGGAG